MVPCCLKNLVSNPDVEHASFDIKSLRLLLLDASPCNENRLINKTVIFILLKDFRMNLQAAKLQLIEWLVRLQDVEVVQSLLQVKQDNEASAYEASLKPMSREELIARAEASNQAIANGEHIDIEDALAELGG